jgi:ATP-binding cassette subfamily G (WHITE) protein 2 (SNQ2)
MIYKDLLHEKNVQDDDIPPIVESKQKRVVNVAADSLRTFTWHDINFDVEIKGTTRRLLNNVSGYVGPGTMAALMGPSGAGKTTLLNVLAQRSGTGVVHGSFLVGGQPIENNFQASTGYCQQQDVHLET